MLMLMPFITVILSIVAVCVMGYVAMATAVGPWIEPTLVLFATILVRFLLRFKAAKSQNYIALAIISSSVGGILATALGFSFPTLFFLDSQLFKSLMKQPVFFSCIVSGLSLAGSLFGFWMANVLEKKFIYEQKLLFPVGQLVYRMISVQNQDKRAKELGLGLVATMIFCAAQKFTNLIPKFIVLLKSFTFNSFKTPLIRFDIFPLTWAVGYVTGHVIAVPLLLGTLSKILILDLFANNYFNITSTEIMLAFCSGLVLINTVFGLIKTPKLFLYDLKSKFFSNKKFSLSNYKEYLDSWSIGRLSIPTIFLILIFISAFLTYFKFSFLSQIYLILFTFVSAYQIISIAGKIGLAYLGRFATFVMVPALFLFDLNWIQITMICTFVEITGGVATDILFGRKIAQLSNIPSKTVRRYQFFGLIVCCLLVGIIFWNLINHFKLGSFELFAQRAQTRALLININKFNTTLMLMGAAFGGILHYFKLNPMLVLGGLLMPLNVSMGLITGGLCAKFTKNKERWFPLWSGVFAGQSIWMAISAFKFF